MMMLWPHCEECRFPGVVPLFSIYSTPGEFWNLAVTRIHTIFLAFNSSPPQFLFPIPFFPSRSIFLATSAAFP